MPERWRANDVVRRDDPLPTFRRAARARGVPRAARRSRRRCSSRSPRPTSCSAIMVILWIALLVQQPRAHRSAAVLLAARRLRRGDAGLCGLLDRSARQPDRLQAAGAPSSSSRSSTGCSADGRALLATDVIISVGAVSAVFGIIQYLILNYDNLGQRPQGTLGLYMTYSGLLMLVTCAAVVADDVRDAQPRVGGAGAAGAAGRAGASPSRAARGSARASGSACCSCCATSG